MVLIQCQSKCTAYKIQLSSCLNDLKAHAVYGLHSIRLNTPSELQPNSKVINFPLLFYHNHILHVLNTHVQ